MKICFFADGESIHTIRWCEYFYSLGYEVHLITFSITAIPNIHIHVVDGGRIKVAGGNWHLITRFWKVRKLLKKINPDIFHALYATSYGVTGALAGHRNYVISALGSDILISSKSSSNIRKALRFAFKRAKWIIVMSEQMKESTREIGVDMSKVTILPFGVDPAIFNAKGKELSKDKFVITSTRNFEEVYNIPHLLHAIKILHEEIPNLHVNLFGSGSLKEKLEDLSADLGIENVVFFKGRMNQEDVAKVLKDSHLYVSVSLSDGSSNSLNEAIGCDVFCIVTNLPANLPWVKDGFNGFLVETNDVENLADKIRKVYLNHLELQSKASPVNQQIFEEKGIWSNNMKVVEEKYAELLKKKGAFR
ncbi:glycosyltransferase [Fluviicola taffensis]|uniref:Glycosyl transferase group 1 n=1 Tax=Fluviicola taffensis (strain DSM 16823 / NCIMB 13979 / RW262) TaxID=755732 RepID=F2I9Z8_FLUTR|nr:glycosyltransferase [Fluviicola taffensis]AEA44156.1 glycosyl transferase group 1 [Fluviicola taffensis DSM 16823]